MECKDTYQDLENEIYNKLYDYVSQDILEKEKVCLVTVWLLSKFIFLPSHSFKTAVTEEIVELGRELAKRQSDKDKTIDFVNDSACLIRCEVKTFDTNLSWPPQLEELNANDAMLPTYLRLFLSKLVHGEHNIT